MSSTFDQSTCDDEDLRDKIRASAASRKRPSDEQAARIGLRPVEAFVRAQLFTESASSARDEQERPLSAAERKQRQREKENEKGWTQCNVRVPKDDPEIRATIRAVAEAAIQSAELYPRIAAVVRDECLQDLVGAALDDSPPLRMR